MRTHHIGAVLAAVVVTVWAMPCRASEGDTGFETPLVADDLDHAAFAQWVDGSERPFENPDGPRHIVWTRTSRPEWDGLTYGQSKTTGVRHMRIGLKRALAIGTALARGGRPERAHVR
jgi:hypothetical protein